MDRKDVIGIAEFLCKDLHLAVFNINYRLTTPEHPWPACGNDCLDAGMFLLNGGIPECPCEQLIVIGGSAGGHLALMTGLRLPAGKVAGIVSISGIADMMPDCRLDHFRYENFFGRKEFSDTELFEASPMNFIVPDAPPILCTHDLKDNVVPLESAENFVNAARRAGVKVRFYTYEKPETGYSHRIWIPESSPHKLYPDLEEVIARFIAADC